MRKILALLLSFAMVFSSFTFVYADEEENVGTWNAKYVEPGTEGIYEAFPVKIRNLNATDMVMDMTFTYLKNITAGSHVEITIKDAYTSDIVLNKELTASDYVAVLDNVPNDVIYCVELYEEHNGVSQEYVKYVKTKYIAADFPVSLTLGDYEHIANANDVHGDVLIKKVGDNPVCPHDADEECTEQCSAISTVSVINENEYDTFYNSLDQNAYYEIQTETTIGEKNERYQAYLSTFNDSNIGLFTRGYSIHSSLETAANETAGIATASTPNFSNAFQFDYFETRFINPLNYGDEYIAKFVVPETGSYTFETVGNIDPMITVYSEYNGVLSESYSVYSNRYTGPNPTCTYEYLIDDEHHRTVYIVITLESGDAGPCGFRIIRNDYEDFDDFSNYRDEVQANCENGIYSNHLNPNCSIDYNGDLDIFAYNVTAGKGYIDLSELDNNSDNPDIQAELMSVEGSNGTYDTTWYCGTYTKATSATPITFSAKRHYVYVRQNSDSLITPESSGNDYYDNYVSIDYSFNFYDPAHKDAVDSVGNFGDSTPVTATQIISFPYTRSDLTIHKNDKDFFYFNAATNGSITIDIYKTAEGNFYTPHLYEEDDIYVYKNTETSIKWNVAEERGTTQYVDLDEDGTNDRHRLTFDNILAGHKYYISVDNFIPSGYNSRYEYRIDVSVQAAQVPTATLSGDVSLTHTIGENITSTDAMKNLVMDKLTCYINNTEVADSTAVEDVELYYNNSVLTPDIVNAMTAATYTITAKYSDVAATGGDITLTVSEAESGDNIVMLSADIALCPVNNENYDWAAAAKMLADAKLIRMNMPVSTYTVNQIISAVKSSPLEAMVRGTPEEVIKAASYCYNGVVDVSWDFAYGNINVSTAETNLKDLLLEDKAVIMQLTSATNPSDVSLMRYVFLLGINLTTHEYIIYDPYLKQTINVSQATMYNGGYNGNSDLRFTGTIIDFEIE